ncbi:inactive serine protease scarface isoform X2 [Nylanderia fulva]|uniref:inactive serine protease scarface isoform X2 n=1 Tax=Nylanderia fulva TaxID=613905 RepID=UPI0010FAF3D4|nr:inactive serine protease scarface isoform X2 [Nylanderia fulva]
MRPRLEMLLFIVALATHTRGLPYGALLPPELQTQDQIAWYDNGASQIQQNSVFPSYVENIVPQQTGQTQFNLDQSQQNTFKGYEAHRPSESQKQYNPEYVYQSSDQSYPNAVDGFTVSCSGQNQICVAKSLCIDGYVHPLKQGFIRPGQVQECKLSRETCCTVRYDLNSSPYGNQINTVLKPPNQYPEPSLENDQRYVPYGENNQADVAELKPAENNAELQTAQNDKHVIESTNPIHLSNTPTEEDPIDYNQIPADTNQQEQYQTGDASAGEPVFPPLRPAPTSSNSAVFQFPVQAGCAAALLCVEEQYCTLEGVISQQPVTLTSKQLLRRVPLSSCRNSETGVVGKCCRDPNYVDPWPTGNLPANYTGGFDEQGFPSFLNIAKVTPKKPVTPLPIKTTPKPPPPPPPPIHEQQQPTNVVPLEPDFSDLIPQRVIPISTQVPIIPISTPTPFIKNPYDPVSTDQRIIPFVPQLPNNPCGVRNYEQRPAGFRITDAAFGEIPWQAMVLWSEERKILCSGALVSPDVVLTAASCVNRFAPNELSVKLGEWKLGYELAYEEPLPFEIIPVRTIKYHPGFVQGFSSNDTAVLLLEHPTTFNLHINTLCLPDDYQVQEPSQCIVTGWGKSILQAHYAGAIMHMVDVDLLSRDVCQNRVLGAESHINIAHNVICGKAHNDNNMCQADIGAPLACYDGKGAYHIAGIYSQDTGCLPTNQVATFSPIDVTWLKQIMSEPNVETAPSNIDDGYDYRKSNLPAGNEYLPPV